jgi:hypothetical protein
VDITLTKADLEDLKLLSYWDAATDTWVTPAGSYKVFVGGSSQTSVAGQFRLG